MKRLSAEWVADTLAKCLARRPGYRSPDEEALAHLTQTINSYIHSPWTVDKIAALKAEAKVQRKDGAICRNAAAILARDLDAWRAAHAADADKGSILQTFAEGRIVALESAIDLLSESRGALDHPGLAVKISDHGSPPQPWAFAAAGIADELIRCLRGRGDRRAGIGDPNGPVMKFVENCLRISMSPEEPPKRSTIYEAVKNQLAPSLAYRRGVLRPALPPESLEG